MVICLSANSRTARYLMAKIGCVQITTCKMASLGNMQILLLEMALLMACTPHQSGSGVFLMQAYSLIIIGWSMSLLTQGQNLEGIDDIMCLSEPEVDR
jgi:hypothetical protein